MSKGGITTFCPLPFPFVCWCNKSNLHLVARCAATPLALRRVDHNTQRAASSGAERCSDQRSRLVDAMPPLRGRLQLTCSITGRARDTRQACTSSSRDHIPTLSLSVRSQVTMGAHRCAADRLFQRLSLSLDQLLRFSSRWSHTCDGRREHRVYKPRSFR